MDGYLSQYRHGKILSVLSLQKKKGEGKLWPYISPNNAKALLDYIYTHEQQVDK